MLAIYLAIEYKNSFAKGFFTSLSLVKYSIGMYFLALSTTKNSYSLVISLIFTVISYVVFSFATNSHITVELILSPLKVTENGMALSHPYDWVKDKLGHSSIILISLIGVAGSNFLCIRTKFPSNNKAIEGKLVIATTLCCLTFSPHLGYDYLTLWLPFLLVSGAAYLTTFNKVVFFSIVLWHWNGYKLLTYLISHNVLQLIGLFSWAVALWLLLALAKNIIDSEID